MLIAYRNAHIHVGDGTSLYGTLVTDGCRIVSVSEDPNSAEGAETVYDLHGKHIIPGLIDVHTHGRAGYDFNDATVEEMKTMAKSYVKSGVTTLMPTLASAPFAELTAAADRILSLCGKTNASPGMLPCFAGIHLEGRYLNLKKRGAHAPEYLAPLDPAEIATLIPHLGKKFHVSAAYELDEDGAFLKTVLSAGGTAGLAHTEATYKEAMNAVRNGVVSFTHTFNAMPPLHHREGGAVTAALTSDAYAELIADGIHIAPEVIKLLYRTKGKNRLVLITDSMQATGMSDGVYTIAGLRCIVKDGKALTEDGHLAGSTLTLIDGLRNLMHFCDLSLDEALPTATRNPAAMVGIDGEVGTLESGKTADFLILRDGDLSSENPIETVILGDRCSMNLYNNHGERSDSHADNSDLIQN